MTSIFYHSQSKPSIRHPFKTIKCFFISLKWAYQRVRKGYCDKDLGFGVKNWFLEMLPEVIDEINKEKCRVPLSFYDDAIRAIGLNHEEYLEHSSYDLYKENYERVEAEAEKRWSEILSRISFLLRETVEWQCSKHNPYEEKYCKAKSDDPEYCEIRKRYYEEEDNLREYREKCEREAVELLLKWSSYFEI